MPIISGSWISGPGGLNLSYEKKAQKFSTGVEVNWTWFNKKNGIVSWNFTNKSYLQSTVILYRNGYYFGNAFFPVYISEGITNWATTLSPLQEKGVEKNSMPIAILNFGGGNKIVAFIFTLAGGQVWSVLEGGFSERMPPSNIAIYDVSLERSGVFCVGYDIKQVEDYNRQTGLNQSGYFPNPKTVQTLELSIPTVAPYVKLFKGDTISDYGCPNDNSQNIPGVAPGDIEDIIGRIVKRIKSL